MVGGSCWAPTRRLPGAPSRASRRVTRSVIRPTRLFSIAWRAASSPCSTRRRRIPRGLRPRDLGLLARLGLGLFRLRGDLARASARLAGPRAPRSRELVRERAAARHARHRRGDRGLGVAVHARHGLRALPPRDGRDGRRARRLGLRAGGHGRALRGDRAGRAGGRARRSAARRRWRASRCADGRAIGVVLADGETSRGPHRGLERRPQANAPWSGRARGASRPGCARARGPRLPQPESQDQPRPRRVAPLPRRVGCGSRPGAPGHDPPGRHQPRRAGCCLRGGVPGRAGGAPDGGAHAALGARREPRASGSSRGLDVRSVRALGAQGIELGGGARAFCRPRLCARRRGGAGLQRERASSARCWRRRTSSGSSGSPAATSSTER